MYNSSPRNGSRSHRNALPGFIGEGIEGVAHDKDKTFSFIRHFSGLVKIRKSRLQQYNAEQQQKNAASSKSGSKSKSKQKKGVRTTQH